MRPSDVQALLTAAGVVLAALATFAADTGNPWWACISVIMVANVDQRAIVTKSVLRAVGTIAGCFVGFVLAGVTLNDPVLTVAAVAWVIWLAQYQRLAATFGYAWALFGITASLGLIQGMQAPDSLFQFVLLRAVEICIGVVACLVVSMAFGWLVQAEEPASAASPAPAGEAIATMHGAVIASLTAALILLAWSLWAIPSPLEAVITAFACMGADIAGTQSKAGQRILGCLLGGGAGILVAALGTTSLAMWACLLFAGIFVFARIHHGPAETSYIGTQGCLAFTLAVVADTGPPDTIRPALERLIGILIGVVILILVIRLLRPLLARGSAPAAAAPANHTSG